MNVTALDSFLIAECKKLKIKLYAVDGKVVFNIHRGSEATNRNILYMLTRFKKQNIVAYKYGVVFHGMPTPEYAMSKIKRCHKRFLERIKEKNATLVDLDGGDLGLGK